MTYPAITMPLTTAPGFTAIDVNALRNRYDNEEESLVYLRR